MDAAFSIIAILLQILQVVDFVVRIVTTITGTPAE